MGWVRQGDGGHWQCVRPRQHPAGTSTPCATVVTLYSHNNCFMLRWKEWERGANLDLGDFFIINYSLLQI